MSGATNFDLSLVSRVFDEGCKEGAAIDATRFAVEHLRGQNPDCPFIAKKLCSYKTDIGNFISPDEIESFQKKYDSVSGENASYMRSQLFIAMLYSTRLLMSFLDSLLSLEPLLELNLDPALFELKDSKGFDYTHLTSTEESVDQQYVFDFGPELPRLGRQFQFIAIKSPTAISAEFADKSSRNLFNITMFITKKELLLEFKVRGVTIFDYSKDLEPGEVRYKF